MKTRLFLLIATALLIIPIYAQTPSTCAADDGACIRKNMTIEQLQEYIRQKDLEIQKLQAEMELRSRTGAISKTDETTSTQASPDAKQDTLARCPADKQDCNPSVYDKYGAASQPLSPRFVLPKIEEFFVPLHTIATPIGTLFGSRKKQDHEIQEYWQQRREALEQANNQCLGLEGVDNIRQCLQDVRQTETRKSQTIANYDQQRLNQANFRTQYTQQLIQNLNNSWDDNNNDPKNINCSSYNAAGTINTNCYGY